jgi:hypothetical protein
MMRCIILKVKNLQAPFFTRAAEFAYLGGAVGA